jgi:maleate cis-trans isomerase
MIDAIEDVERTVDKSVVNSNQAVLWAALRRLEITEPIANLGRLFHSERQA